MINKSKNEIKRDKIAGAIYGFAIGDAMGATTEFMTKNQIKKQFGIVDNILGGGWLNLEPGKVTDDTQMTICVMKALMLILGTEKDDSFGYNFSIAVRNNFIAWKEWGPKDIGGQCLRALNSLQNSNLLYANRDEKALGNGSLMRAMPCAILGRFALNRQQGFITHHNSICDNIISEYSKLLYDLINKNKKYKKNNSISLMPPTGHIVNSFNNAKYWLNKDSFKEIIVGAVNDGGDADTIAAITGSLAGARFGYSNIPTDWINQLSPEIKEYLENFKNFSFSYLQI